MPNEDEPVSEGHRQHVLDRIRHALIEGSESPALVANLAATFIQAEPTDPPTVPVVRIAGADVAVYMEDDGTLRFDVGRSPGCHVRKVKLTVDGYNMWGVGLNG